MSNDSRFEKGEICGCDGKMQIAPDLGAFGATVAKCTKCPEVRCTKCRTKAIQHKKDDGIIIGDVSWLIRDDNEEDGLYYCLFCGDQETIPDERRYDPAI